MQKISVLGGILLVAGTALGGGMLALPIATGMSGFYASTLVFVAAFIYMLYNLFLLLEVNLWMPKGSSLLTMSKKLLGQGGQCVALLFFGLLLYAVLAAYITGGAGFIHSISKTFFNLDLPTYIYPILFTTLFGLIVYFGTRSVDYVNRTLLVFLIAGFVILVFSLSPHVDTSLLKEGESLYIWSAIPVIVLSFTSHLILPSLRDSFNSDTKKLVTVLLIGSLIPLTCYIIWELSVLGIIPISGIDGIATIRFSGQQVKDLTDALINHSQANVLTHAATAFSFTALLSSFLGAGLSLFHFLTDGAKSNFNTISRNKITLLTFFPPLIFALFYPQGFVTALSFAGVFVAILYGILPAVMVWQGRYCKGFSQKNSFYVPGGKPALVVMMGISLFVILMQISVLFNWLPS